MAKLSIGYRIVRAFAGGLGMSFLLWLCGEVALVANTSLPPNVGNVGAAIGMIGGVIIELNKQTKEVEAEPEP